MASTLTVFALSVVVISLNLTRCVAEGTDSEGTEANEALTGGPEAKSGYDSAGFGYEEQSPQVFYGGQYGGRCDQDGFYYNDDTSFITCNHGIAYAQQCAPGTRNGMATQMRGVGFFSQAAFCDINLVDFGYAAFHSQRGNRGSGGSGGRGGYGQAASSGYQPSSGGYAAHASYSPPAPPKSSYARLGGGQSYHSSNDGASYGIYGYGGDAGGSKDTKSYERKHSSASSSASLKPVYNSHQSSNKHDYSGYSRETSRDKGYGQSSYNSQSHGGMQHGNQGYGSSRYTQPTISYKQPTYQVFAYRPVTSYKPQTSYGKQQQQQVSYGRQPQSHSAYGRKHSGYYSQRRYHTQPVMKY